MIKYTCCNHQLCYHVALYSSVYYFRCSMCDLCRSCINVVVVVVHDVQRMFNVAVGETGCLLLFLLVFKVV